MPRKNDDKQAGRQRERSPAPRHEPRPLRLVTAGAAHGSLGKPLFQPLAADFSEFLGALPELLGQVLPLNAAHRRDLPDAVFELSTLLTSERSGLALPYWSSPRLTSAYLRYFLPWNLIRLGRVLPGLPLPTPPAGSLLVDLGSGPLTLPLALWWSRPDWRETPLEVLAVDTSVQPLDLGRKLFSLAAPGSPWKIRTLRAPLYKALRDVCGTPFLLTAGNVLNELVERKDRRGTAPQAERLADMAAQWLSRLAGDGAILCVEPGTRLGGTVLEQLRAGALEAGLRPVSPCPHDKDCPLLDRRGPGSGWCHAVTDNEAAPVWLRQLARDANLTKTSLSLAHLLLRPASAAATAANASEPETARVLSDAFAVPELGLARYACSGQGLVLLAASAAAPQGALVRIRPSRPPRTDPKSGARVMVIAPDA